ncbi:MAG: coproporphyrinogen III oxidase family protein [Chloroflexi bacterium]|nr:coproporphyrinogen III oxidase family protein [Chloroflexota bacterium]
MIPGLLGWVTRREGQKFLKLRQTPDARFGGASLEGKKLSLYVHIPFCRTLCPFCCFNRYPYKEDRARAYFKFLKKELDRYLEKGAVFSDVYFGGGTPTILMDELSDFVDYARKRFTVGQTSLETTPFEINPQNLEKLREQCGVNRLSIGVQAFDDAILRSMGRVSLPADEIKIKVVMAQGRFDTLNIDFVFNYPGQSFEQFRADVAMFKSLGIDQATFYPLMPSPHKKEAMERKFNQVDNTREKAFYDIILSEVYSQGYTASTAWCFSRGNRLIDEYIVDSDDYIGIGSGSVSLVEDTFYVNTFSLDRYAGLLGEGRLPVIGWRKLSRREYLRYYLLTKLFALKIDKKAFFTRFGREIDRALPAELLFLKGSGLVRDGGTIEVTRRGMYPVSVIMREFFSALNTLREQCIRNQL